jgi:hypothetical protein
MTQPNKKLRQVLYSIYPLSYRIKQLTPTKEIMEKKLFIEIIDSLKSIEDRRDFMQEEIGMDMTAYEDQFFHVIENLMKLHFKKEQLALIQMYLYQLVPDKDWDGTITIQQDKTERTVNFRTSNDVWEVISSLK